MNFSVINLVEGQEELVVCPLIMLLVHGSFPIPPKEREREKKNGWLFCCKLCYVISVAEYSFIAGIHKPKPHVDICIIGDVFIATSLYHGVIDYSLLYC